MAEFVQTMKDWRRMCQHMEKMGGDRSCDICQLGGCNAIYEEDGSTDYANVEEKVAAWAAEHPEPQYPTWGEWFAEQGELSANWKDLRVVSCSGKFSGGIIGVFYNEIPADIAQKLGIEPKE